MIEVSGNVRGNGLTAAAATDPGLVRDHNEDRYFFDVDNGVFLVVDGVGGQAAGDVAAALAAQTIQRRVARVDAPAEARVREAITLANNEILLAAAASPRQAGMACVLTLAVFEGRRVTIGHVGDSRAYKLHAKGITKLTHDHSPVGEREDAREISERDAMQHVQRNEVYRDVGSEPREPDQPGFIEIGRTTLEDDEAILLCSDGLSDLLPALEINRIVRAHPGDPDRAAAALVGAANALGGKDNITVVIAEGPRFGPGAEAARSFPPAAAHPADEITRPLADLAEPAADVVPETPRRTGTAAAFAGAIAAIARSRSVALLAGVAIGMAAVLYTGLLDTTLARNTPRPLLVGGGSPEAYQTISAALAAARAGDVVLVEPGEYAETLDLKEDVEVRATAPGQAILIALPQRTDWISVIAAAPRSTLRGFRISGRPSAPVQLGVAVRAAGVLLDDLTVDGAVAIGVGIDGENAVLRSSVFEMVGGVPVRLLGGVTPVIRHNVFRAAAGSGEVAIDAGATAAPRLAGNLFIHFARAVAPDARAEEILGHANVVVTEHR